VRVHGGNGESEIVTNQISIELHTPAEQQQQKTTDITFDGIHDMDSDEITYALPFTGQVLTLMARQFRTVQAGLLSNVLLFQYVFLALLMGVLWLRLGYSEPYIFLRVSMIFWLVGTWMYFPSFESIFVFHMDMKMLKKELSVGAYSLEAYFVARSTLLIPLSLYWPLLFTTIAWWMSGMNDGFLVYVEFFLLIALVTITSQSFGLWVGSAFKMEHSVVACLSLMCVFFSYAGFLVPLALIPDALRWPQWISIMGHGFNVAMWIVFNQGEPPNHECAVPSTFAVCNEGQDYITTTDIFDFYLDGLTASDISTSIGLLFAMLVGFRVLAYLFLRRTVKQA
jgi:hypothetical protein